MNVAGVLLAGLWLAAAGAAHGPPGAARSHAHGVEAAVPPGAILFMSARPIGPLSLHATDAEATVLKDFAVPVSLGSAHWSPDGRWIGVSNLIGGDADESRYVFSVLRADGTGLREVARSETGPATWGQFGWSPDGRRIAFLRRNGRRTALFAAPVRGGRQVPLTRPPAGSSDGGPAWSPDGRRFAFVRERPCGPDGRRRCDALHVTNGASRTRIVFASYDRGIAFAWSPDGRRIAVALYCCGAGPAFVINADGTGLRRIADIAAEIAWSPDGRWIAIGYGTIVRPDGTGRRRVGRRGFGTPSWSPDSRAFVVGGEGDVWVVPIDGSGERRLTQGWRYGYGNYDPEWNPRGASTAHVGGTSVLPANATDSVLEAGVVRTTRPIARISADGSRVAAVYDDSTPASGWNIEAWDVPAGQITRFGQMAYAVRPNSSFSSRGFALVGDRVATTSFSSGGGMDSWRVSIATLPIPRARDVYTFSSSPLENLAGDGALLVTDAWGPCRISQSQPCAREPKFGGRLLRVEDTRVVEIASDRGPLTLLSVDGDRILVDRENGALQLFRANGTPLYAITYGPARLLGATLEGDDIVALTTEGLSHYDAATGDLRHHRRLAATDAQLADVQDGVAVYLSGTEIHLHRLGDGQEAVIRPEGRGPVLAELEAPGLFYSYAVDDPTHPGRIAFVPFDQLPLR